MRGVFLLLALSSCHMWRGGERPEREPVEVRGLSVEFPQPEQALLSASLDIQNPRRRPTAIRQIWWELWLDGRFFAAGTQAQNLILDADGAAVLELSLPMTFKNLPTQTGARPVELGFRGKIVASFGTEDQPMPFQAIRRVLVEGAPLWNGPRD